MQKEAEAGTSLEDRQFMLSEQLRVAETRIKVLERENASLKRLLDMFGTSGSMLAAGTAQGLALGTGVRGEGGEVRRLRSIDSKSGGSVPMRMRACPSCTVVGGRRVVR